MDLYYGDESHLCEEAYVPYGWKCHKEDIYIPSQCGARLNCFAMIDRICRTHWFTTVASIDAGTMSGFLDSFSLTVKKKTVAVLDNAPIHRAKKLFVLCGLWEKRGLHLFFFPPYILHNLTTPKFFGECSKENGFSHVTASLRTLSSMPPTERWRLWEKVLWLT